MSTPGAGETKIDRSHEGAGTWWVATGLLAGMVMIFTCSSIFRSSGTWVIAVRAFSEAAMIGALADWFAVTALFRHPLGLPIPHTAIIPNNKSRIGRSLGHFIQNNFVSEQVLDGEAVNISGAIIRWLEKEDNRRGVIRRVRLMLPQILDTIEEGEIRRLIDDQVTGVVQRVDVTKVAGKILGLLTVNGLHEVVLDEVVRQSRSFFRSNEDWFRKQIRESTPWFVPEFVDRRMFDAILNKTEETFTAALNDRNHELRLRVHAAVEAFITKLECSDEFHESGEMIKAMLLENPIFRQYISSVRDGFLRALKTDIRKDDSEITATVERMLSGVAAAMQGSPELQVKMNQALRRLFRAGVGENGGHVADMIARTIDSWNTQTLVNKLEQQVGRDLQYIRINGTVVGGLVGLLLFFIERALNP